MSESFESPREVAESAVIEALNTHGLENPGARELLTQYAVQCEAEANAKALRGYGNRDAASRANIEAALKLARLYLQTNNYREYGRESLQDALTAAEDDGAVEDLVEEITDLLKSLG